jgi:hypothetical protein
MPEINISIASDALPVGANTLPRFIIPFAFQNEEPFSSAKATSSSTRSFSSAQFPHWIWVNDVACNAYISVAAWPISRAILRVSSASTRAASG